MRGNEESRKTSLDRDLVPRNVTASHPQVVLRSLAQKLRALQAAFASTSLPYLPYVVALDAEAEFTSRIPPWAAFEWWARERTALGWAHGRREAGGLWGNISAASCALSMWSSCALRM